MRDIAIAGWLLAAVLATGYLILAAAYLQPPPLPQGQPEDVPPAPAPGEGLLAAPPAPPVPETSGDKPRWPSASQPVTPVRAAAAAPWDAGTEPDTAWRRDQGLALAAALRDNPVTAPTGDLWVRRTDPGPGAGSLTSPVTTAAWPAATHSVKADSPAPENTRPWEYLTGEWPEFMATLQARVDEGRES